MPNTAISFFRSPYFILVILYILRTVCFFIPLQRSFEMYSEEDIREVYFYGHQEFLFYFELIAGTGLLCVALLRQRFSDPNVPKSLVVIFSLIGMIYWLGVWQMSGLFGGTPFIPQSEPGVYILLGVFIATIFLSIYLAFRRIDPPLTFVGIRKEQKWIVSIFLLLVASSFLPSVEGMNFRGKPEMLYVYQQPVFYFYLTFIIAIAGTALLKRKLQNTRFLISLFSVLPGLCFWFSLQSYHRELFVFHKSQALYGIYCWVACALSLVCYSCFLVFFKAKD